MLADNEWRLTGLWCLAVRRCERPDLTRYTEFAFHMVGPYFRAPWGQPPYSCSRYAPSPSRPHPKFGISRGPTQRGDIANPQSISRCYVRSVELCPITISDNWRYRAHKSNQIMRNIVEQTNYTCANRSRYYARSAPPSRRGGTSRGAESKG